MAWTIYTFGDGDLIARVLQAVALMVNGGLGSLTRAAMIVGIIVALGLSSTRMLDWPRLAGWFIGALLVFVLLIQVRTTVAVEDVVDTRIAPQVVGDIPLLFAVPASVASEVSYRVTLLSTSLELGGQMGSGLTLLRPTTDLQALMESSLGPGDLRANLVNYLHECVVHPGSGISPVNAANNPNLLQAIASNNVVVMVPFIQNGEVQGAVSCADMYTQYLLPPLDTMDMNAADLGLRTTLQALACRVTGGRALLGGAGGASCSNPPAPWSELDDALQNAIGGLVPAQRALATVLIAKLWPEAEMDLARQQQDPAMAMAIANDGLLKQLELQAKTGQEVSKAGLLRQVRALADGMVYLGGPLLLAMAATPFVWKGLGLYLRLFVWLALWGPLQALANFIVLSVSMSDISSQTTMLAGITMGNLHELFTRVVQANAIGYDVLIAVPGVALAIAWGGVGALGGALSGAAGGVLATGRDVRRRVESGDEVLASSLAKPQVEAGMLRRPPDMGGLSTADWQGGWESSVVSRGLQSTTMRLPDGRAITTMQNGTVRVTGAGNDYTIQSNGLRSGTQLLSQSSEIPAPGGQSLSLPAGTQVTWTGNSGRVNMPSRRDPLTGQDVTPVAVFAQDPRQPNGLGSLVQESYDLTYQGLQVRATRGPAGSIQYDMTGRTDVTVVQPNGSTYDTAADVHATAFATPNGDGSYELSNGQARLTYLTPDGQRRTEDGPFALPGMSPEGRLQQALQQAEPRPDGERKHPVFMPFAGEGSNQHTTHRTQKFTVNGVEGRIDLTTIRTPDGAVATQATVTTLDGRTITATLPNVSPDAEGPVPVSARVDGYLQNVKLGGSVPQGADGRRVDVPLQHVAATTTVNPLVLRNPEEHVTDLALALTSAPMQLVQVKVPDPTDPARQLEVSGVLNPPGSPQPSEPRAEVNHVSATQSELPDGTPQVDVSAVLVPASRSGDPHWTLSATEAHSQSTQPISVEPPAGELYQGGHFELVGDTKITNNQLHGRFATVTYVSPNGGKQVLGSGNVTAQWDGQNWRVVSLETRSGADMMENNRLNVDRVEQIAPGVDARVTGVVNPATGDWVTKRVEIGVGNGNQEAVRRAFQTGPITPLPGGTLTIDNTGAVSYHGPAEVTLSYERDGKRESVTAPVMADVHGARSLQKDGRQVITWQGGTVEQTLEGKTTTEALPKEQRAFFERHQGGPGKAQVTLAPDGRALAVDARAGTESTVKDTRRVDVGTLHIESSSAYALAYQGNSRLGDEIVSQPDPTKRYTTAMQIVRPLAEEATQRVQKILTAAGFTELSGGLGGGQLQELLEKYAGKGGWLGKLAEVASNVVSLKAERRWSDEDTYNFFYSELMRMYRAREKDAETKPAAFVKGFTEDLRQFATSLEREVMSQTPNRYGADAVRGWADAGGQTIRDYALEPAVKAAGDLAEAAGRGVGISALTGQPAAGAAPVPGSSARPAEASPTPSGAPPAQGAPAGPASSSASPPRPAKASTESTPTPAPAPGAAPANGPSTGSGGHVESKRDSEAVRLVQQHLGAHAADKGAFSTATHQFIQGELDEGSYRAQVRSAFRQAFAPPDKHPTERQLNEADAKAEEFLAVVREARRTYADKRQQPAMTGGSSPARSSDQHASMGARAGGAGMGTARPSSPESAGRAAKEVAPDKTSRAAGQAPALGSSAGSASGAGQASAPSEPPRESRPSAPPRDTVPGSTADRAVDGRQAAPDRAEPRASSADRSPRVEPGRADAGAASAGTPSAPSAPRDPFAGIQRPPDGAFTRTPQDDTRTKGDKYFALINYAARLMGKVHKGELTLEEVKRELQRVDHLLKPGTTLHGLNWILTF